MHEDLLLITSRQLTFRGIAYIFYVMFIEPSKSLLIIVSDENKKKIVEELLTNETLMLPVGEMCARPGFKIKIPLPKRIIEKVKNLYKERFGIDIAYVNIIEILTNKEYKQRWRDFAGWRPAFVEEEMHLKSLAVDYLESIIKECIEKRFVFETPLERFSKRLLEILGKAEEVLTKIEQKAFKTAKELNNFLRMSVRHPGLIALILDMIKFRGIELPS